MVVMALAKGLPRHGFAPHVVCIHGHGEVGRELVGMGVPVDSDLAVGRYDPRVFSRLLDIFRQRRGALFLSLDHHDAVFWGGIVSACTGMKGRVLAVHSTGLWGTGSSFTFSDRLVLPLYERVVALAPSHARYLVKSEGIDEGKIRTICNGVDTRRFLPSRSSVDRRARRETLGLPRDGFVVTIVAALRPEKNHEMLLRASAQLSAEHDDFVFLIVGEGGEAGKLQALAGDLKLRDTVRFLGRRNDVPEILSVSDASVLCSHPVVETFPLSILEAMASGLPVVSTSVGSIPEMLSDGAEGILIPTGDVEALAEALRSLHRNPSLGRAMGERARRRVVGEFSEDRMVAGYAELFDELLAGKRRRN